MEGTNEEKERQIGPGPMAATTPGPSQPVDTDDWIHQLMQRLTPDEIVIRRPKPGNLLSFIC